MRSNGRALLRLGALFLPLWILFAPAAHADLIVGPGGVVSLGSGALDLGCSDINIAGTGLLQLNSAPVTGARNVTIQPGATLDFGTGSISFAGTFLNQGTMLNQGPGSIIPVTNLACAPGGPSIIGAGSTAIPTLSGWALTLLALLLGGGGILLQRRRT